jgi:hypothetical protein
MAVNFVIAEIKPIALNVKALFFSTKEAVINHALLVHQ